MILGGLFSINTFEKPRFVSTNRIPCCSLVVRIDGYRSMWSWRSKVFCSFQMLDVGYYGIFFIATTHTPFVLEKNQAKKPRAPSWFNREILHSEVKPSYAGDLLRPQTRPRVSNPKKVAEVSGIPPAICREIHRFLWKYHSIWPNYVERWNFRCEILRSYRSRLAGGCHQAGL